jgi:hypothetical protein
MFRETGNIGHQTQNENKPKQSRETGNIGHQTQNENKPKQSRETGNIGHQTQNENKPKQSRETGNIGHQTQNENKPKQSRETGNIGHQTRFGLFSFCVWCPMFPVSLDCPFLNAPSVFSNVHTYMKNLQISRKTSLTRKMKVMYLCVRSISFASFCEFLMDFGTVPTLCYSLFFIFIK